MYAMAWRVGLPKLIGDLEVLILITSCICHDLDHPGYNNIYQVACSTNLTIKLLDLQQYSINMLEIYLLLEMLCYFYVYKFVQYHPVGHSFNKKYTHVLLGLF